MVVDHADGLHERVDYRGPHEVHAASLELLADGVGYRRQVTKDRCGEKDEVHSA